MWMMSSWGLRPSVHMDGNAMVKLYCAQGEATEQHPADRHTCAREIDDGDACIAPTQFYLTRRRWTNASGTYNASHLAEVQHR